MDSTAAGLPSLAAPIGICLPPLLQTALGGGLSILGGWLAGRWLLRRQLELELEKLRLESFREAARELYAPLLLQLDALLSAEPTPGARLEALRLLDSKATFIALCPSTLRKGLRDLRTALTKGDEGEVKSKVAEVQSRITALLAQVTFGE